MEHRGFYVHEYAVPWNEVHDGNAQQSISSGAMSQDAADPAEDSHNSSSFGLQKPFGATPLESTSVDSGTSSQVPFWSISGLRVPDTNEPGRDANEAEGDESLQSPCGQCIPWKSLFLELFSIILFYRFFFVTLFCFCLPLVIFMVGNAEDPRVRCLYVIGVVILCWLSNCIDAYAVALLPFILFPGLRVVSVGHVATSFMNSVSFLILGASMLAAALHRVRLDVAAADWLVRISPKHAEDLALCLMTTCFMVSTCLSNTGTMLIFCPIIDLMIRRLHPEHMGSCRETETAKSGDAKAVAVSSAAEPDCGCSILQQHEEGDEVDRALSSLRGQVDEGAAKLVAHCSVSVESGVAASRACAVHSLDAEATPNRVESVQADPITEEIMHESPELRRIRNHLFIGCAYAATLGGSATVTGATSNAVFLAVLDAMYATLPGGSAANPVTYTTWLIVSLPLGLIQLFIVWVSLGCVWIGPKAVGASLVRLACKSKRLLLTCCCCFRQSGSSSNSGPTSLTSGVVTRGNRAGKWVSIAPTMPEKGDQCKKQMDASQSEELYWARVYVIGAWLLVVCLWLSRRTVVAAVPGWGSSWEGYIDDSWPAMVVPLSLWFLPLRPRHSKPSLARATSWPVLRLRNSARRAVVTPEKEYCPAQRRVPRLPGGQRGGRKFEGILTFSVVEKEMDWGLMLLLGSGFVVASVSHACGLDKVLVENMEFLSSLSCSAQVACIMAMAALVTQVTSNTATASILMPLLSTAAKGIPGNPLLLMLAANFATTLGFLLPVSTASNAIIVRFTRIGVLQFFLSGLLPLVLCLVAAYLATFSWVSAVFHL